MIDGHAPLDTGSGDGASVNTTASILTEGKVKPNTIKKEEINLHEGINPLSDPLLDKDDIKLSLKRLGNQIETAQICGFDMNRSTKSYETACDFFRKNDLIKADEERRNIHNSIEKEVFSKLFTFKVFLFLGKV